MSRQSLIENFFKSKASPSSVPQKLSENVEMDNKVRKCKLSIIKPVTPIKRQKFNDDNKNVYDVINLCSDEEDIWENTPKMRSPLVDLSQRSNESEDTVSEASTVLYSPENNIQSITTQRKVFSPKTPKGQTTPNRLEKSAGAVLQSSPDTCRESPSIKLEPSDNTSQKSDHSIEACCKTPKSILTPNKPSSSSHKGSQSSNRYFSPVKKRSVINRSAEKAKRSLGAEFSRSSARILFEDDLFAHACEGMDDKTIFLLEIINKCLNTPRLKDLLDNQSQALLSNCLQTVKPGMKLVCRLYWRKDGWYKKDQVIKICSEEEEPINDEVFERMMVSLDEMGLVVQNKSHDTNFDHFVTILKREELNDICKELKLNMKFIKSKQNAVDALRKYSNTSMNISNFLTGYTSSNSRRVLQMLSAKAGPCYKLSDLARTTLYKLYIIMYLGMDYSIIREKRLELILIYDKIKRETYPISKDMPIDDASVVFKTRDQFERYLSSHTLFEDFLLSDDDTEKLNIVEQAFALYKEINGEEMAYQKSLPEWLHRFTPARVYIKILEGGIQVTKKMKQYELALEILDTLIGQDTFRRQKKAEWFAEKALILHSLSRYDEAAEVLIEGFKSDLSEELKDSMRPRAKKIANQKNITLSDHLKKELLQYGTKEVLLEQNFAGKHIEKQPMERASQRGKVKFETRTAEGRQVHDAEEYCIYHYLAHGEYTHGEHWEGRIATSLFFLLFWDIIYSRPEDARGVFLCHYQQYPLDLFTDSFYANRQRAIDDWLRVIEGATEDKLLNIMRDTWSSRPEQELSGITRGRISWDQVRMVATCLGPRGVAAVCARLATNYRYAHSGFPDLTLWHNEDKTIKFVEVKTDTDKPSMKQLQWLQYLRERGIPAELCYVGHHTTRQRSRNKLTPKKDPNTTTPVKMEANAED